MAFWKLLLPSCSFICITASFVGSSSTSVNAAQHQHRQNDLLVVAFVESIHKYIIGYVPDEREQKVIL
jgi:hypothetical protein